jgi:hypothetical protein
MTIKVDDFLYEGNSEVTIEIANDGAGSIGYYIAAKEFPDWLEISSVKGVVEDQTEIVLRCNRAKLTEEIQNVRLLIKQATNDVYAFDTTLSEYGAVAVEINARSHNTKPLPPMTFLENNGVITIEANHFCGKKDVADGVNGQAGFIELVNYGRSGAGMKVFPATASFKPEDEKPTLAYRFLIEETGEYGVEVWATPTNPVKFKHPLRFMLTGPKDGGQIITAVDSCFNAGSPSDRKWCQGVLDNIRISKVSLTFEKGVQEISIGALDANFIAERILIYKRDNAPLPSYLGPPESFHC